VAQIFLKIRELYQKEGGKFPDPILHVTWNYSNPSSPPLVEVLKEVNGKALADLEDPATKQQSRLASSFLACVVERRRYDVLRQLDLLRLVHRSGESDGATRSFRSFGSGFASGMGLVLACESPRPLQSRVV